MQPSYAANHSAFSIGRFSGEISVEPSNRPLKCVDLVGASPGAFPMALAGVARIFDALMEPPQSGEYLIGKLRGHRVVLAAMDDQQRRLHAIEVEDRRILD